MTDTKHTPGNWCCTDGTHYMGMIPHAWFEVATVVDGEQVVICSRPATSCRPEAVIADGRLIAAAPELLRVVEMVLEEAFIETNPRLIDAAEAATAKARGAT